MWFTVLLRHNNAVVGSESSSLHSPHSSSQSDGWRFLFDGKSVKCWRGFNQKEFPKKGWVIQDDCLKHLAGGGGGDIITVETFDEFDLEFEWKLSRGSNSGVKYFILEERKEPIGHEYQIIDDPAYGFDKPGNKHQTASFYDVLAPKVYVKPRPVGEFNLSRILVRGTHVEHWLNGQKVLEYELGSPEVLTAVRNSKFRNVGGFGRKVKGHILLQDHGGEVWFRNIRIKVPESQMNNR